MNANRVPITKQNIEDVKFIREEVRFHHSLLGARISWYVASQAFLVTPFAIAIGSLRAFEQTGLLSFIAIPVVGIVLSLLIRPAISAALERIELQNGLLERFDLSQHLPPRDKTQHKESLKFANNVPTVFLIFWMAVLVCGFALWIQFFRTGHVLEHPLPSPSSNDAGQISEVRSRTNELHQTMPADSQSPK